MHDDLIERLEKATKVDGPIIDALAKLFVGRDDYPSIYGLLCDLRESVPAVGAALALVEKTLPGWSGELTITRGLEGERVWVWRFFTDTAFGTGESRVGAQFAILAGLLRSLRWPEAEGRLVTHAVPAPLQ